MATRNRPYVLELAAMIQLSPRNADATRGAALRNGVADDQLAAAAREVRALTDQSEDGIFEWVRQQYLADGRAQGYVGPRDNPTLWVLGQMAAAHYAEFL